MRRFRAKSGDAAAEVEANSWSGALSQVLDRLGISGRSDVELSPLGPDLEVEVTDSVTGAQICISTVGFEGDGVEDGGRSEDDSTEFWDPPTPARSAVYAQREDDGAESLARIRAQCSDIKSTVTIQAACELGLDILMTAIPAESASVLLREGETLRFVSARGPRADALVGKEMPAHEGIAGAVLTQGKGLVVQQVHRTDAHYREVDRAVEYHTRTILAVPMIDSGTVLGVVELLNPFGAIDFAEWHQRAAVHVGRHLAMRVAAD